MWLVMKYNNHHRTDKTYKFMFKRLGVKLHQYFFNEGAILLFIDTELAETGQRRDLTVNVDGKYLHNIEFMSTASYDSKLYGMFDYHLSLLCDKFNPEIPVKSSIINTSNPNHGKSNVEIPYNINFHPDIIFTKDMNGWEVLSTLIHKVLNQEELSDKEAIDLLLLPDMNINMNIKVLMKVICFLINHANISDNNFKTDIMVCEINVLKRFYTEDELSAMIKMLVYEKDNPERMKIIETYGPGFDDLYFDGKYDEKIENAKNLLTEGVNEEIISRSIGISISKIKELKRKL